MKNFLAIALIIALVYTPGCAHETQEENSQPVTPEISLNPILLPTEKQPEISEDEDKEGVRFIWPNQEWLLMKDETALYAVAQDLTYRLELQLKRRQIQKMSTPRLEEKESLEAFVINDVVPVKEGLLVVTEHNNGHFGLAHLRRIMDEELEWLVRDSDESPQYIISQDKSKVVFKKLPEGHLSAYNTLTGKNTSFPALTDEQFCDDWVQQINLSPLGGYLTYEVIECTTGHPIQFTIVGADSGRLIRDHLPGMDPGWDQTDQQIVFQLVEGEPTLLDEPEKISFQRLGMYSLETTDVIFFNRIAPGFSLYRSPLFSQDNAYLIYPVKNEQESRLIIYNTVQQLQQSLLLPEGTMVAETDQWASMNEKMLIAPIRAEDGYQLFIHHIASELTEIIGPIDHWKNEDANVRWFNSDRDSNIYYIKNGRLMQTQDGNHRSMLKIPENTNLTGIDTWQDWLVITVVTSQGEKQLYFVGL